MHHLRPLAFASWLALIAAPLAAQQAGGPGPAPSLPPATDSHTTFRAGVELVTLNVTVTDGRDHHIGGLNQGDFQVLEDGVPQDLSYFAATKVPLDVAVMIDTSSSMRDKLPLVQQAADNFLKTLHSGDRACLVEFNNAARFTVPFTADVASVEAAIQKTTANGGTALYQAIYVTLDQFGRLARQAKGGEVRRPAIVVLTDGEDNSSLIQYDDLLDRARRAGVAIYSISILDPYEAKKIQEEGGHRFFSESDFALKQLAQETGARSFFPKQLGDLAGVYSSVADELSAQYALGYMPKSARNDGAFHRLLVRILSRPDARPRTRTGYYSPGAARAALSPDPLR